MEEEAGLVSTLEVDPIIHKFKMLRLIMNLIIITIIIKNRDPVLRKRMVKCENFMIIKYFFQIYNQLLYQIFFFNRRIIILIIE